MQAHPPGFTQQHAGRQNRAQLRQAVAKMPPPRPCKAGIARAYREAEPEGMAASSLASPSPAPIAKETCHAKQENAEPGGQMCTAMRTTAILLGMVM